MRSRRALLSSIVPLPLLLAGAALAVRPLGAQATAYVVATDPAYEDLDVLEAAGFVRDVMVGERPYSEAAFRRFIEEAAQRASTARVPPRLQEALDRLSRRFGALDLPRTRVALTVPRADLALADSPGRPYRAGADGLIQGDVDPLLQRNQGEVLDDGATVMGQAGVVAATRFLAGSFTPRLTLGVPRGPASAYATVSVAEAYARAVVGPVAVDFGRNNFEMGYGADGGPLLSDNARGMDVIRLAADRPVRLPSVLGRLGLWQASMMVADLGTNRRQPNAILTVMRGSARPSRYLEIGLDYLNQEGGEDAPTATLGDRLHDLFVPWTRRTVYDFSDKVAGADVRIAVPQVRSALYANFLTTDDRGRFEQPACGCWQDADWLVGAEALGLGADGRTDVRAEWRHAGARAHTHYQFTSGMTLDGRTFGDPLGPNAASVSASVERALPSSRVGLEAAWERYSGDDWYWALIPNPPSPWDYQWYRRADNPDEIRMRAVAHWRRQPAGTRLETTLRVGYEHVTRFAFTGASRNDALALLSLRYLW
jgi:hypothetical protein